MMAFTIFRNSKLLIGATLIAALASAGWLYTVRVKNEAVQDRNTELEIEDHEAADRIVDRVDALDGVQPGDIQYRD